jgi:hypothetical protein
MTAFKVVRFLVPGQADPVGASPVGSATGGRGPHPTGAVGRTADEGGLHEATSARPAHDASPSFPESLRAHWSRVLAAAGDPPPPGRPVRVAVGVPLELVDFPAPPFAAIDVQWFADAEAALANDECLASVDPDLRIGSALVGEGSCQVVAEEVVARGQQYLEARWAVGGERYKMMSFGKRSPGLTREEFSSRWRAEGGRLGGEEIPAEVRGLAYVQNHPVPLDGHEWPFDAVNEVWFERLDHLLQRRAWFAARQDAALRAQAGSFMSPTQVWSMFLGEVPLA